MALFSVSNQTPLRSAERNHFILVPDDWDDWFKFETKFHLYFIDGEGKLVTIGTLKIGRVGLTSAERKPLPPDNFDSLERKFFSVGQNENYYETLSELPNEMGKIALTSLRDVAYDLSIFNTVKNEEVMRVSLTRTVNPKRIIGRYHNLAHGRVELTRFGFSYRFSSDEAAPVLRFEVEPDSLPPSNIHVLIGRNGVGKTRLLDRFTRALLGIAAVDETPLAPVEFDDTEQNGEFANVIFVSFSAFDPFGPIPASKIPTDGISYAYIGLKRGYADLGKSPDPEKSDELKGRLDLQKEFISAVRACRIGARLNRWSEALKMLESDPLFEEADVSHLVNIESDSLDESAAKLFNKLSSGHGIVLLTITRLVELVDERSLILLDEPEGHLHPPLLSAFVRALSQLLSLRNGVAIVATHSPVVLQEVPSSCVSTISRSRNQVRVDRPEIETFGENVGILTREIFGLEVQRSGFHTLLMRQILINNGDYEKTILAFNGKLGAEARTIARGMSLTYTSKKDS